MIWRVSGTARATEQNQSLPWGHWAALSGTGALRGYDVLPSPWRVESLRDDTGAAQPGLLGAPHGGHLWPWRSTRGVSQAQFARLEQLGRAAGLTCLEGSLLQSTSV